MMMRCEVQTQEYGDDKVALGVRCSIVILLVEIRTLKVKENSEALNTVVCEVEFTCPLDGMEKLNL
jgi:hypothetical protein